MKRLLLVLLFLPALSFADDYTYWHFGYGIFYQDLGSAKQAFESIYPCTTGHNGFVSCEYIYPERNGPSQISACLFRTYENGKGDNRCPVVIVKQTGSCPLDQVFDFTLQQCTSEPEPDQCEAGNEIMRATYAVFGGSPNPPSLICNSSCEYNFKHLSGVGISNPDKPDVFKYNAMYMSNGNNCDSETPPETEPDQPPPEPEPPQPGDPDYCPPGWSKGPDGSTCFRDPDNPDPGGDGGGDGGTGGGDGGDGGTGGGDGGTGGGDGGTGGGDGGTGGGDGGTGGGTGDGGTGGGTGDGGTGGGTGDGGTGGGTGDGDGEGEGEGKYSGGADCETAPECSGDAIQCGIVDQQWRMRCDFEKAYDYEAHKGDIEGLLEGDEFKMIEGAEAIEVPSFLNMHARWLGSSSCPPDETMTLRLGGGRTFALSYEPLCQAATSISPLLVIIATVLATLYIGRGLEG